MEKLRAIVHYHFKKGMEEKGLKFMDNELIKKAQEMGCHDVEVMQDTKDPTHFIGTGVWNSLDEARSFQSIWNEKEKQLSTFCTSTPHRELYKIKTQYKEKLRKTA